MCPSPVVIERKEESLDCGRVVRQYYTGECALADVAAAVAAFGLVRCHTEPLITRLGWLVVRSAILSTRVLLNDPRSCLLCFRLICFRCIAILGRGTVCHWAP